MKHLLSFCVILTTYSIFGDSISVSEVLDTNATQVSIVDEIIKGKVQNRVNREKRQVIDKIQQKFIEEIVAPTEKNLDVPLGKFLGLNQRLILNTKARFTDFDPFFETVDWGGPTVADVKNTLQPVFDIMWHDFNKTAINEKNLYLQRR